MVALRQAQGPKLIRKAKAVEPVETPTIRMVVFFLILRYESL